MKHSLGERFKRVISLTMAIVFIFTAIPFQVCAAKKEVPPEYYNGNIKWYTGGESCNGSTSYGGGNSDGSDVYLIGDSLSVHSQNEIKKEMPNITFTMNGSIRSGSYFAEDSSDYGPSGITRLSGVGDQPIIVFALGTNGGVSEDDITALINALKGKDKKVVLMTIAYGGGISKDQQSSTNTVIKNAASQYDNITYMDWESAVSSDVSAYIGADNVHPTEDKGRKKFAEIMHNAVNEITTMGSNISTGGTGNFDKILTAKNANEYVFDVPSYSQWSAQWGDGDTVNMKKLLENYGDLAYQLGDAVGAPYIAILVQMRYEDPNSVCGANNFWGNGCDPSHAYRGGSTIQGKDLGEGFVQYAQTLTNGYHDQALGEPDPKRYLELIGPTWVQGDPNGPGYGSIEGMKKSVDALTAYIESPEGQEIVKNFGNYHGTYKGGKQCKNSMTDGGVTTLDINGITYAFPLAYATKENYLENNDTHPSVLSSKKNGWYHHDYPALDMGIYMKMVTGKEFNSADFPQWPTSSVLGTNSGGVDDVKHMNSSTGANVVALTDGVLTYYEHYSNGLTEEDQKICAISSLQSSTTGDRYIYIHLGYEDEYAAMVGQQVKVGDVIGHVGKMPCAQYTQAHVHLQTADENNKIKDIIDKLYDALPADAAELAAREATAGGGESDKPIEPLYESSTNVNCDSRTTDIGIYDGYNNGSKFKVRLCALDKTGYAIKSSGEESHGGYGSGYSGGYAIVNSRVSGAFAGLAAKYYKDHNTTMDSSSSFRTNDHQSYLYNTMESGRAAKPGYSNHQAGLAIDFNTGCAFRVAPSECHTAESDWLGANVGAYGLSRPVNTEAWHVQP